MKTNYPPYVIEPYVSSPSRDKMTLSEQMQEELEPLPAPADSFMSAVGSIMPKTTDDFYEGYIRPSKHRELSDILEQLKNYPTPVSDNDANFNYLLKERDRLQSIK